MTAGVVRLEDLMEKVARGDHAAFTEAGPPATGAPITLTSSAREPSALRVHIVTNEPSGEKLTVRIEGLLSCRLCPSVRLR